MSGAIYLEPFGGLGNRMRALVSGINLAHVLQKELRVVWKLEKEFNCSYDRLFLPNDFFEICEKEETRRTYSSFNSSFLKKKIITLINQINNLDLVIWEQDLDQTFFKPGFQVETLSSNKNIYIRSCEQFFDGDNWNIFSPIEKIRTKIEQMTTSFTSNTIGVHIRRTDNGKSIKFSPIDLFIEQMEKEITENMNVTFFLATDDPGTQHDLTKKFPCNLLFSQKELSRNNEAGIQDALVDLICLSKCNKIIGSYWSSFTEVASAMGGVTATIVKK